MILDNKFGSGYGSIQDRGDGSSYSSGYGYGYGSGYEYGYGYGEGYEHGSGYGGTDQYAELTDLELISYTLEEQ